MRRLLIFLSFLLLSNFLIANSIRLYNDSPYKLRAVVRAADGTYLGEMILVPQSANMWTDAYSQLGSRPPSGRSQTPYVVQWYCLDGSDYAICNNVATGATILAQSCEGGRICKPKPPLPGEEQKENLDNENSVPYNPYLPNSPYNPNNPNSPYSPYNPNNPQSPYSPNNPQSPYNPKNPSSPYYQPEGGVTGAASGSKVSASSAQSEVDFDPLSQEISSSSGEGLQDLDPNSLFNRYHPNSPYNSKNHRQSNTVQSRTGINHSSQALPSPKVQSEGFDRNSLFNRNHPDSPYNSKNHGGASNANQARFSQMNEAIPSGDSQNSSSSDLQNESRDSDSFNSSNQHYLDSPYYSNNHICDEQKPLWKMLSIQSQEEDCFENTQCGYSTSDGQTQAHPNCPYQRPRSTHQRPPYYNKERIPRGNYKRPEGSRMHNQPSSAKATEQARPHVPCSQERPSAGNQPQSLYYQGETHYYQREETNKQNTDMPSRSPVEEDNSYYEQPNRSPYQQESSVDKGEANSSQESNQNDCWKNLPYKQRDFYNSNGAHSSQSDSDSDCNPQIEQSLSNQEDWCDHKQEPADRTDESYSHYEYFYEEEQSPHHCYEEDDYYRSGVGEDVQYYSYP